jgi:hypothetical protein
MIRRFFRKYDELGHEAEISKYSRIYPQLFKESEIIEV